MSGNLSSWIRRREHPLARVLFRCGKAVRHIDAPLVPGVHKTLYGLHKALTSLWSESTRVFYWTPMFRSRLEGTHRRLHIAGRGMPLVTGPVSVSVGDDCRFSAAITVSGRGASLQRPSLVVGNNVGIGWQTTIAVGHRIIMEDNVRIAGRAFLAGYPGHPINAGDRAAGLPDLEEQVGDIILRRDVWLGTGCSVSAGVEIGQGTIVAAGSVVTRSLPAGVLAGGVPARIIRELDPSDLAVDTQVTAVAA